tara:strand:- start:473 stop:1855 length:1383 start_codon:yes stop_codon:yes gene_type:complete
MAIEDTPLQIEIQNILMEEGANPVHAKWSCLIMTPEETFQPLRMLSLDIERDYLNKYSDYMVLEVLLPAGAFSHDILPYKQELLVEITREPMGESHEEPDDSDVVVKQYRAVIHEEKDDIIGASSPQAQTRGAANLSELKQVKFQLFPLALERIRLHEVGGIYRKVIPGDAIRYILTYASNQLDLPDDDAIVGVDIVDWDNKNPHPHIVLPQGTKVQDVAAIIQDDWGGVYNTGIGCYLQDNLWYVWPEFNTKRFDEEERVLRLINLPPKRYPGIERTWRMDEYQLVVLSTGEVSHKDLSHHNRLNHGNASRYTHGDQIWANPNAFGKNFGEAGKDNKFRIKRNDNNSEYVGSQRPNYDVAPVSPSRITNNSFSEASRLAKRNGAFVTLTWEHSKPELIFPGMPARLMYLRQDEIEEVDGVVVKTHHYVHNPTQGPTGGRHICNTAITLFLEYVEESDDG